MMTSLPAPEQSAQMLVIEVGKQEMKKRKGSMTDLFRRLSRSGSRQRLFSRKGQWTIISLCCVYIVMTTLASSSKIASNTGRQLNSLPEETDSNTYTVSSGGKRSMKKVNNKQFIPYKGKWNTFNEHSVTAGPVCCQNYT